MRHPLGMRTSALFLAAFLCACGAHAASLERVPAPASGKPFSPEAVRLAIDMRAGLADLKYDLLGSAVVLQPGIAAKAVARGPEQAAASWLMLRSMRQDGYLREVVTQALSSPGTREEPELVSSTLSAYESWADWIGRRGPVDHGIDRELSKLISALEREGTGRPGIASVMFDGGKPSSFEPRDPPAPLTDSEAAALAQRVLSGPAEAKQAALSLRLRHDRTPAARAVWSHLVRGLESGAVGASSALQRQSSRWSLGSRATLQRSMPTLAAALSEPRQLGGLLSLLSFLRMVYPYDTGRQLGSLAAPERFARRLGAVFRWNELAFMPTTESFRRHIIRSRGPEGPLAVELKMPGELPGKLTVGSEHFTVANALLRSDPKGAGTVKPLFFGRYRGRTRLYGALKRFPEWNPLALALFSYEDGKRLSNVVASLCRRGLTREQQFARLKPALVDAAAATIRLHELGYRGTFKDENGVTQVDAHNENVRVTRAGRGVLVADFNVFNRGEITDDERRWETIATISGSGIWDDERVLRLSTELREALFKGVVRKLTAGVTSAEEAARLRGVARRELGLE
jgi:hypothetical protein